MDSHYYTNHRGQAAPSEISLTLDPDPQRPQQSEPSGLPEPSTSTSQNNTSPEPAPLPSQAPEELFCHHVTSAGRRCRMLRAEGHPSFCAYHASPRPKRPRLDDDALAADLLDCVDDFSSVFDINIFLGNIAVQLARKRISRADAIALAYIGQLLLNSNRAMDKELDARRNTDGFIIDFSGLKLRKPYGDTGEDTQTDPTSSAPQGRKYSG